MAKTTTKLIRSENNHSIKRRCFDIIFTQNQVWRYHILFYNIILQHTQIKHQCFKKEYDKGDTFEFRAKLAVGKKCQIALLEEKMHISAPMISGIYLSGLQRFQLYFLLSQKLHLI